MIMKSILKYTFAICCLLSLALSAGAQTTSQLASNKTATYDYETHEGEITMDSYLTGAITSTMKTLPVDIVLVLDWSTSMFDNNRITNLTSAAQKFVDKIASMSTAEVQHRVSVVTFATGATMRSDFVSMSNSTNVTNIKNIIADYGTKSGDNMREGNSTQWWLGMCLAYNVLRGGIVHTRFYGWKHKKSGSQVDYGSAYDSREESQDNSHQIKYDWNDYTKNVIVSKESSSVDLDTWAQQIFADKKDRDGDGKYEDKRGNRVENLGGKRSDAKGFVIFFTDGQPTGLGSSYKPTSGSKDYKDYGTYDSTYSSTDYNCVGANITAHYAYEIKRDSNTRIYCIKLGTIKTGKVNQFAIDCMTNFSSKYPDATRFGPSSRGTATTETAKFFQQIDDGTSTLDVAFDNIGGEIKEIIDKVAGEAAVTTDYMNNAYFKLPEGAEARIKVYENDLKSYDAATKTYTFYPETDASHFREITSSVKIRIVKNADAAGNEMVCVDGYNYADHWCGIDESKSPATVHGARTVIKMPFVFSNGEKTGELQTNTGASGIFPAERNPDGTVKKDEEGNTVPNTKPDGGGSFMPIPSFIFCSITIKRTGLDIGESAVYDVVNKSNGKFMFRVSLGGEKDVTTVEKTVYGIPDGTYTITETPWNWAYEKATGTSQDITASEPTNYQVTFTGPHKEAETDIEPWADQNHSEIFKVNRLTIPTE